MKNVFSRLLLIATFSLSAGLAHAQGYDRVDPPQATAGEGIEVLEFFWYGCPHCNAFHPHIDAWEKRKPGNVNFRLVAAPLNPSWTTHSRAYYAAEVLGVVDQFHGPFFDAIHKQRKRMRGPDEIAEFVDSLGLDSKLFMDTMQSFAVETRLRQALQLADGYRISGVPTVTVNGKFKTSASKAGGYSQMIQVIDTLVAQESGS